MTSDVIAPAILGGELLPPSASADVPAEPSFHAITKIAGDPVEPVPSEEAFAAPDGAPVSSVEGAGHRVMVLPSKRTLKLVLEYDGTDYMGWQLQPRVPTIQGELEARLERLLGGPHRVHGSGRTDAGVHARGQVAHFQTEHGMTVDALKKALNALLPPTLVVRELEEVPSTFHARFQAHHKQYAYQLWLRPERSPFYARYAWHHPRGLELGAMQRALTELEGTHDFGAFRAADCVAPHAVRTLYAARVVRATEPGLVRIELEGNGFLKHMVRNIVGTVVEVGQGRRTHDAFVEVFRGRDRTRAGKTAPAHGLWLEWVAYGASQGGAGVAALAEPESL